MRTKNKKWTVPILVLVPVFALAALLAAGLYTANNADALGDDECGFVITSESDTATMRGEAVLSNSAPCFALGDSIDIIVENKFDESDTDAARPVNVYVSGGSDYSKVQMATAGDYAGAVGVSEIELEVPQPDRRKNPGEAMVTVTRSMGKTTGVVLVSIYGDSADFIELLKLDSDSTLLPDSNQARIDSTMVIVFLGKPSLTRPDGSDDGDDLDKSSSLTAFNVDDPTGENLADPTDTEQVAEDIENDTGSIYIFAEVRDEQGRILVGGDDVESTVTFNVEFAEGSDLKTGRVLTTSETEDVGADGRASIELDGWKTGAADAVGPVKVTVTAMYIGPTGTLDLGKVVLSRIGEAETIVGSVFNRACLVDDPGTVENVDQPYADDKLDVSDDNEDCMMDFRYGTGQMFIVKAHVEDGLGSVIPGTLTPELEDVDNPIATDAAVVLHDAVAVNANVGDDTSAWLYTVDSKAEFGDHMITVSDGDDDNDVMDLVFTVAVAGPPAVYMIDGPDRIALGRSGTFMVQAYDKKMGIPHFDGGMPMVEVFIQGLASGNTRYITNGMIDIDPDTGMGEFIVYAPNSAMDADVIRIFVSTGDMEKMHEVTFGDPDATPDPMETDEFTADYTVTATSDEGSGMVDVSWTRSDGLSLSLVSLIQGDDVVDFTITGVMSAEFSGVDPGKYDVSVFSFRITEDGKDGEIAFGTVTVE